MGKQPIIGKRYQLLKGGRITVVDSDSNGRYNRRKDKILIDGKVVSYKDARAELRRLGVDLSSMGGAKLSPLREYASRMDEAVKYANKGNLQMAEINLSLAEDAAKRAGIRPFFPKAERVFLARLYKKAMKLAKRFAFNKSACRYHLRAAKLFAKYAGIKFSDKAVIDLYKRRFKSRMKLAWEFARGMHLKKITDPKKWSQTRESFAKKMLALAKRYAALARIKFPKSEERRILARARKQ